MIPIREIDYDESELKAFPEAMIEDFKVTFGPTGSGMLHPVILIQVKERFKIIAGKKRLRAFLELGLQGIPATIIELGDKTEKEISLEENIKRHNVPWYELVALELEWHNLRVAKFGKKRSGRPTEGADAGWSGRDTARELKMAFGSFSEDIILANALKRNPSLAKIKDKKTALQLVKQTVKREDAENEQLIPPSFDMNQVFLGNSVDILAQLPADSFDACITDPPWIDYKDAKLTSDESTIRVFGEIFRTLKPNSFLYAIVSTPDFIYYRSKLPEFGFNVQAYPLIWYKSGTITHGRRGWEYARDYEPILLATKGSPVLTSGTELSSVLDFPSMHYTRMIHPHEKPIELLQTLIKHCTYEGGKILDPFSGSGVTLAAASSCGRYYIGIEREKAFYDNIIKRLEKNK
jgi:site-specific DNA-methyltransferase (adenine-specific)